MIQVLEVGQEDVVNVDFVLREVADLKLSTKEKGKRVFEVKQGAGIQGFKTVVRILKKICSRVHIPLQPVLLLLHPRAAFQGLEEAA